MNIFKKIANAIDTGRINCIVEKYGITVPDYATIIVDNILGTTCGTCTENPEHEGHSIVSINVNYVRKNERAFAATIQHELIHSEQIKRGDLYRLNGVTYWKHTPYRENFHHDTSGMSELESIDALTATPWELEAYGRTLVQYGHHYNSKVRDKFLFDKYMAYLGGAV